MGVREGKVTVELKAMWNFADGFVAAEMRR